MSKAWFIPVDGAAQEIEVEPRFSTRDLSAKYFSGETLDFMKVRYLGRVRTMAVLDSGMIDGHPVNSIATEAYQANCKPGTRWAIHGPAVIFESLLP